LVPAGSHHRPTTPRARGNAKRLRRDATDAEAKMWQLLRARRFGKFKFRRQIPIEGFIVDFVCFERKIVIEVDGSHHADSVSDRERDATLAREGFRVLRYWNNDVLQRTDAVLADILGHLETGDL
jgi:very-short-patch-repair endonuclease